MVNTSSPALALYISGLLQRPAADDEAWVKPRRQCYGECYHARLDLSVCTRPNHFLILCYGKHESASALCGKQNQKHKSTAMGRQTGYCVVRAVYEHQMGALERQCGKWLCP